MIIEPNVDYNIVYTDASGQNSIAKTITVTVSNDIATVVEH